MCARELLRVAPLPASDSVVALVALVLRIIVDPGVGSNPGGEFDAPVNESPLVTLGIELNDSVVVVVGAPPVDFFLDPPLARRPARSSPPEEFRLELPRVVARPECADPVLPVCKGEKRDAHSFVVVRVSHSSSERRVVTKKMMFKMMSLRNSRFIIFRSFHRRRSRARTHLVRRVVQRRHLYRLFRAPGRDRRSSRASYAHTASSSEVTKRFKHSFPSFEYSYCLYIQIDANRRFFITTFDGLHCPSFSKRVRARIVQREVLLYISNVVVVLDRRPGLLPVPVNHPLCGVVGEKVLNFASRGGVARLSLVPGAVVILQRGLILVRAV